MARRLLLLQVRSELEVIVGTGIFGEDIFCHTAITIMLSLRVEERRKASVALAEIVGLADLTLSLGGRHCMVIMRPIHRALCALQLQRNSISYQIRISVGYLLRMVGLPLPRTTPPLGAAPVRSSGLWLYSISKSGVVCSV